MTDAKNPWDEAIETEAALTAYSMSRLYPLLIEHCREIDAAMAVEIADLFARYCAYMKDPIAAGKMLAESGTEHLSSEEIGSRIDASLAQADAFFTEPKNRNRKSCEAYKAMIEFDLQFVE